MYLLGYDVGSSSVKVALVNALTHEVVTSVQYPEQEFDMISRQTGWAEQHPEMWWQAMRMATHALLKQCKVKASVISGIGLSYQMHGLVLIDNEKQVIRPAIIWCDSRAVAIGDHALETLGEKYCFENLLNVPGNFTATRLRWVRDNEPRNFDRIWKIMLPGDYLAMRMTNACTTTVPGLSEAILWNYNSHLPDPAMMAYTGISTDHLPDIVPTFGSQGKLSVKAADELGLKPGIEVGYRAGDQPNNALSLNVLHPGEMAGTSGTSGVLYGIVDQPIYDRKGLTNTFSHVNYTADADRFGLLLCLNGAGIQYSWLNQEMGRASHTYNDMERMAATVPVGAEGVSILPFGNGAERMFHNQTLRAHLLGLQFNRHRRAHLYRAALEGVAFSFVHGARLLQQLGLTIDIIRVPQDNMFQSAIFCQTISTLLDCQIDIVPTTGAIGAARASGVAVGFYEDVEEALQSVKPNGTFHPNPQTTSYNQAYQAWQDRLHNFLYPTNGEGSSLEIKEKETSELRAHLEKKQKEVARQSLILHTKDDLIRESISIMVEAEKGELDKNTFRKLRLKLEDNLHSLDNWATYEQHFDVIHDQFFERLKQDYPKLSFTDIKLCGLLRLHLTTKDIARRLNLSVRGVETRRYRLRKKLDLGNQISLIRFLEDYA